MADFTIHAAKTHLSRLIARAAAGEEIIILHGKTPVARLMAISREPTKRRFGACRGEFEMPETFFDPLPDEELRAFEGEGHDGDPLGHARGTVVDDRRSPLVAKGTRRRRRRKN
jgi:antitoxin (DNA-binding transcriptional repressor) of toxin-antitoxin stability system